LVTVFESSDELYATVTPFLQRIVASPEIGPKFVAANTSFCVHYTEPEALFLLDATQDPAVVSVGDAALAGDPEVSLHMSADDGHKFWLGNLNMPVALARRKIRVEGPVTKLMGLLPALQPAFAVYRSYLAETGRADLAATDRVKG
jgi:hypothetical protein